jgi:hypothetical protein
VCIRRYCALYGNRCHAQHPLVTMSTLVKYQAVQVNAFNAAAPTEGATIVTRTLSDPGPNEVQVKLLIAGVNPSGKQPAFYCCHQIRQPKVLFTFGLTRKLHSLVTYCCRCVQLDGRVPWLHHKLAWHPWL